MSDKSTIEWTDATWNPIRAQRLDTGKIGWHCVRVSEECDHCYAAAMNLRCTAAGTAGIGTGLPYAKNSETRVRVFLDQKVLEQPLHWKKPRKIFVCSMTDLFGEFVPFAMIEQVYAMMALANWHTYQVLTKRPQRRLQWHRERGPQVSFNGSEPTAQAQVRQWQVNHWKFAEEPERWPLPNVWEGVTAGTQKRANQRVPDLLNTPAAVRFVSYEPALEPVKFDGAYWLRGRPCFVCKTEDTLRKPRGTYSHPINCGWKSDNAERLSAENGEVNSDASWCTGIDWIISGCESGRLRRPSELQWFLDVDRQCRESGVAHFHKQRYVDGRLESTPELGGERRMEFPK